MQDRREGFGLYLHVPYCVQRCGYCDFFTMALQGSRDEQFQPYLRALGLEIEQIAPAWADRKIRTIFLGGGTPSLLTPEELTHLFAVLRRYWPWEEHAEVTLEVNPETITLEKAQAFREIGVNRISMGVQSLDPKGLSILDRVHSLEKAHESYVCLREAGFTNINCDMIFGWPGQTLSGLRREIQELLRWQPEHVSCYELILEAGTPITRAVQQGHLTLPEEEERLAMYRCVREQMQEAGLCWYEVSNYAKPGLEAQHNVDNWWGFDYLGLGPGAHSFRAKPDWGSRRANPRNMPKYLAEPASAPWLPRSWQDVCVEAVLNGLRLRTGWSPERLHTLYSLDLTAMMGAAMVSLEQAGYLESSQPPWTLTERGTELLDAVVSFLQNALPKESLVFPLGA